MDSTQFFKNKIKNIKQGQDIIETITKWQNKTYKYKNLNFQFQVMLELNQKEILKHYEAKIDNLKVYRLKTCEVGNPWFCLTLILQNNSIHQIIY